MNTPILFVFSFLLCLSSAKISVNEAMKAVRSITGTFDTAFLEGDKPLILQQFRKNKSEYVACDKVPSYGIPKIRDILHASYSRYHMDNIKLHEKSITFDFYHYVSSKNQEVTYLTKGNMTLEKDDDGKSFYVRRYNQGCPKKLSG
ncbi:unnamed protein product [Caenorhabditis bovis]|uniref:Nuclear transport factor 2 family protein n=1 Tax=Caenorhabditis bovis TaxID=2654633 RepID=A0A8S1FA94_9PELO|nr:unnamed protein product [Caenorhabditis bovis]